MWYMGGKFRQSKVIIEVLRPCTRGGDTVVRHHAGHGSDGTCEKLVQYIA